MRLCLHAGIRPASRQRQRERGPMDNVTTLDEIEPITEAPVRDGLSAISIAKSYDKRTVLTDVSVSVGRGEVVGQIGRAPGRERVCQYVEISVVAVALKNKNIPISSSYIYVTLRGRRI